MQRAHSEAPLQQEYFDRYSSGAPINWDIGRPQSAVERLVQSGFFWGRVLDVGCGFGDNARCIAQQSQPKSPIHVVATDFVPKAIEMAKERTNQSDFPNLTYMVLDALKEDEQDDLGQFDFVLDSCLFHGLSDENRQIYIRQLRRWLKPQGIHVQLAWSEKETLDRPRGPRKITKAELQQWFSVDNGWQIQTITDEIIDNIPALMGGRSIAYLSIIQKL
ncbi:unnamed protein product [Adineta ricciae]|uniref:Methyltransferase domain-containing protein n=1 Tax=Adineta ricciae TaxID=249248 RepID=A0A815H7Y3_ADIRI|nr:unnamed protein product [Adineta ricciae]CAF1659273.1 unnamed protein product [Adineta ricciae]